MILINKLFILFAFTMFSATATIKDFNEQPKVTQIMEQVQEETEFQEVVKNHPKVMEAYKEFEMSLRESTLMPAEADEVLKAAVFSAEKHKGQARKGAEKTPYIIHPIGVAHNLLTIGQVASQDILIAALLHDTVEDTNTSPSEITERFGMNVEGYVREVTDDKTLPKLERKKQQIEHAADKSEGAALIKLADKLYNMKNVAENPPGDWSEDRNTAYMQWGKEVVDRLPPVNEALKAEIDVLFQNYIEKHQLAFDDKAGTEASNFAR